MVSFDEFKQSLGILGNKLSNEEIDRIRHIFDRIADMAFTQWMETKDQNFTDANLQEYNDMNNERQDQQPN